MKGIPDIFAHYAKTSAHGDLAAYIRYGSAKLAAYDLPAAAIDVLRAMVVLEPELARRDNTPADKRRVMALIDRFKAAIPGFAGGAGAPGSWADEMPAWSWAYARARYAGNPWEKYAAHRAAEAAHAATRAAADAVHHFRVPMRVRPLDAAAVRAMIDADPATLPAGKAKARPRASAPAAIACPACTGPLSIAGARFLCGGCGTSWTLMRAKPATVRTPSAGKAAVDWRAAGLKAAETRRRRLAEAARAAESEVA